MASVVSVVEDQLLLSVGGVLGMIQFQHNDRRRLGLAGDELIDERDGKPVAILTAGGVLQAGQGRRTGQVGRRLQRQALQPELEHRIGAPGVGVATVLVGTRDLVEARREPVVERMGEISGVPLILERGRQACGQTPRCQGSCRFTVIGCVRRVEAGTAQL